MRAGSGVYMDFGFSCYLDGRVYKIFGESDEDNIDNNCIINARDSTAASTLVCLRIVKTRKPADRDLPIYRQAVCPGFN